MFLPTNITLKFGDSGDFVTELQRRLSIINCFNADAINGFYDGNTVNGVTQFQSRVGIQPDGVAGPETLRRLNGAISGDNSAPVDNKKQEEEERQRQQAEAEALQRQMHIAEHPHILQPQDLSTVPAAEIATAAIAQTVTQAAHAAQTYQQPQPASDAAYQAAQHMQQTLHQQQQMQQPPQALPSAGDILAQMLMAQPQPQQQHHPVQPQVPQPAPMQQPIPQEIVQPQPVQQQVVQPQPAPPQIPPQQQFAQPQPQPVQQPPQAQQPVQQTAAPAPEQPRGIVGRAMQYANEVVQKLATYFEAKLPNHVIDEVKSIGHAMASSGVKEAPIPAGPEQQQRGPEQQRGQQQGQLRG